jgi:ribosomal protein S9
MSEVFAATGRRKNAVAQVRISRGSGKIEVNGRPLEEYFPTPSLQFTVLKPFEVTKTSNSFDVQVKATGGGATGQAGAVRLAIARALLEHDETGFERGRFADSRPENERAQKIRTTGRSQTVPVFQAIKSGSNSQSEIAAVAFESLSR